MRQYQPGDTFKLPEIAEALKTKELLDTTFETTDKQALIIPTMKVLSEAVYTEKQSFLRSRKQQQAQTISNQYHDSLSKESGLNDIQSHFTYEHFTGNRRNVPGQPDLIRLLSETELDIGKTHKRLNGSRDLTSSNDTAIMKKPKCEICKMPAGKHKHWCKHYQDTQKAVKLISGDKPPTQTRKKRVSFGDISYEETGATDTTDSDDTVVRKLTIKYKAPKLIRSSTTLDGLHLRSNQPNFSSLHRDVYIQALAEARARKIVKLKSAYDFSTQTTLPYLFSYFGNVNIPTTRHKRGSDGMKHIFGDVKLEKYYDMLTKDFTQNHKT